MAHLFKGAILLFAGMVFTYCVATYFELRAAREAARVAPAGATSPLVQLANDRVRKPANDGNRP